MCYARYVCLGSECSVFLLKGSSGSLQPRICCNVHNTAQHPELGEPFAAARTMSSSSAAAPTTNHPIVCPKCHPELTDTSSSKRKSTKRPARAGLETFGLVHEHKSVIFFYVSCTFSA